VAVVRPFQGIRYSPERVGDVGQVVSPPYDVIPEERLAVYRERSPYNVVRLTRPGTDYGEAARLEADWRETGVLRDDPAPAFYPYETQFDGQVRRGLLAAVRLSPYGAGEVLPHERTHGGPKADRLELYRATGTAFEPLWFVYRGAGTDLPGLLERGFAGEPALNFESDGGERHQLWTATDPAWQGQVSQAFAELPLLIADGHHRYETALTYAAEVKAEPDSAANHALVLLVDIDDPGLVVLPTHRVMTIAPVAVTGGEPTASLEETLEAIKGRVAAGHYRAGQFQVLPLEGELAIVELHRQVIDNLLGKRSAEEVLMYTRDAQEAVRWVDEGRGQQGFFLDAPDLAVVLKLAEEGKVLPQKSTYFNPKPPTGMVFMKLDANRALNST
jgi:uncharacterized protein (DUF1015 family)